MRQLRRSRWLRALAVGLAAAALVALFGWLLWRGPAWVYRNAWPRLTPAEQVTATGQFRTALIQAAGAIGAVVALAYTARTYRLSHRGQLTERFSKALERLGSDEPYVRLGGVHTLAHLLRDSADHHQDVVEVLVAFVRQRAPRAARAGVAGQGADAPGLPVPSDQALPAEPAPDVQAALTALGRRPRRPDLEPEPMLNLRDLPLTHRVHRRRLVESWGTLDLRQLHLASAWLVGADLTDARLDGANLTGAWLWKANLAGALLDGANLTGALLKWANLAGAILDGANLTGARLMGANLTDALLARADLTDARLMDANLTSAEGLTQAQLDVAWGNAATRLPPGLQRPARWAAAQAVAADTTPASGAAPAAGGPSAPPTE